MIVTTVHIKVKPEHLADFIEATLDNHKHSTQEPGNLRFDVLQHVEDPTQLTLYEAYETAEAVVAHKQTAHYHRWRETVADWFAEQRYGVKHRVLAPTELSKW